MKEHTSVTARQHTSVTASHQNQAPLDTVYHVPSLDRNELFRKKMLVENFSAYHSQINEDLIHWSSTTWTTHELLRRLFCLVFQRHFSQSQVLLPSATAPIISPQHSVHSAQLKNQKWRVKQKVLEPGSLRCLQGSSNCNSCQPDLLIGTGRSFSLLLSIQVSQLPPFLSYAFLTSHPCLSQQPWVTQQPALWSSSKAVATKN